MKLEDEKDASTVSTRMNDVRALDRKLSSMILLVNKWPRDLIETRKEKKRRLWRRAMAYHEDMRETRESEYYEIFEINK